MNLNNILKALIILMLTTTIIVAVESKQTKTSLKLYVYDCGQIEAKDMTVFDPTRKKE